jgi:hypothetical protein
MLVAHMPKGGFKFFTCPNCKSLYEVIKTEVASGTDNRDKTRCACGSSFAGREGKFVLKYFILRKGIRSRHSKAGE